MRIWKYAMFQMRVGGEAVHTHTPGVAGLAGVSRRDGRDGRADPGASAGACRRQVQVAGAVTVQQVHMHTHIHYILRYCVYAGWDRGVSGPEWIS
jgi:hypothetical protein